MAKTTRPKRTTRIPQRRIPPQLRTPVTSPDSQKSDSSESDKNSSPVNIPPEEVEEGSSDNGIESPVMACLHAPSSVQTSSSSSEDEEYDVEAVEAEYKENIHVRLTAILQAKLHQAVQLALLQLEIDATLSLSPNAPTSQYLLNSRSSPHRQAIHAELAAAPGLDLPTVDGVVRILVRRKVLSDLDPASKPKNIKSYKVEMERFDAEWLAMRRKLQGAMVWVDDWTIRREAAERIMTVVFGARYAGEVVRYSRVEEDGGECEIGKGEDGGGEKEKTVWEGARWGFHKVNPKAKVAIQWMAIEKTGMGGETAPAVPVEVQSV